MSGSSLDGIDLALCCFGDNDKFSIEKSETIPLPDGLESSFKDPLSFPVKEFLHLSSAFAQFVGKAVRDFLEDATEMPCLIVSHGHTIYHNPDSMVSCQIGNGGIIASLTGINTLSDLRIQDVAMGGQGAPLASLADKYLFQDYNLMLNLGGIANISVTDKEKTISWDISPCNQVLNKLSRELGLPFDNKGRKAKNGKKIERLYRYWQSLEYFSDNPPKSLDNYWVKEVFSSGINFNEPVEDSLNTMCHFITNQLFEDLRGHLPKGPSKMFITGGGGHNDFLIQCINKAAAPHNIEVVIPTKEMIDYKEALLMAYMGHRYLEGKINVLASATGAKKDIIGGALYLGNG